ncbi:dTMP kinase [Parvularcula sp. ZS-1/3]|uniref:Thymidylate kinase n=1 Tax=Parvularcula mediterranea TaxID=2732508 RepID=A0A7Y3RIY4_9PROT|nr:dTMP kinase [Parvularcula mediterranea]
MSFITFEGPEGAGKSTQIKRLAAKLENAGRDVVLTREPGGAPEAEALRALLLDKDRSWSPTAEALLMNAARDAHVRARITPALDAGKTVLCDRFSDSTIAYQVGVDEAFLRALQTAVVPRMPDLTLLFDLPVEVGLARAEARGAADRFEAKGEAYHRTVRERFIAIAAEEPERVVIIDAEASMDTVEKAVTEAVNARLPGLLGEPHGHPPAP